MQPPFALEWLLHEREQQQRLFVFLFFCLSQSNRAVTMLTRSFVNSQHKRMLRLWLPVSIACKTTAVFPCSGTMVKCLIRIKTKVNVHLRMINHCYRDVKVRVLTLGPRLLGKVLGSLPLIPLLPDSTSSLGAASRLSIPQYNRLSRAAGNTQAQHRANNKFNSLLLCVCVCVLCVHT